jgi:HD-GYP domain-containing protein (c-di-GMP phosphodiesterase class II)/DNA-binding CsgD family transcriptional regulator
MSALSIATDLGMGQPLEFAMQSCIVAVRLGEKLGLSDDELRAIYYQSLLRYIGCNAETRLLAAVFGDELSLRKDIIHADPTSADFMLQSIRAIRAANAGDSPLQILQAIAGGMMSAMRFTDEFYKGHCEVAERLAERLGLEKNIVTAIKQVYARWDGKGIPALKGEAVAPSMLVVSLAQDAIYAYQLDGIDSAVSMVKQRKSKMYAPKHVEVFCKHANELLKQENASWQAVLALEPGQQQILNETEFDSACDAIADYTDIKSPYFLGHSSGVARVAESAALKMGLPEADIREVRRAALLHDIGRVGVSTGIWGKEAALTDSEWEKIRLHPYHTERVLARSENLAALGKIASMHHERLDGSGYHRGATTAMLTQSMRILASADVYHALLEVRPHRPAFDPAEASERLLAEAQAGRLDREAVNCVLSAMGHPVSSRRQIAGGLSERELDVLRLIARGHSIKEMAERLHITPKTVDSHIQHIYHKIGVNTRAGATLYAMENKLL